MKFLPTFSTIMLVFLLISCGSENEQQPEIDYSTVPLIELTKEFSITESEDYLPNQLQTVMVAEDGSILISQRNEKSIHQFDRMGNHVAKVAGPGRGPGELSRNARSEFRGEILYMINNHGLTSEYRRNDNGIYEHFTDHNFRFPGNLQDIQSEDGFNEFYIRKDSVDYPFLEIPPEFTTDLILPVKVEGNTLNVGDKVFSLRKHSSYIEITNDGNSMTYSSLPYRYSDYMEVLPSGKIMIQRPWQSKLQVYDSNYNLEHEVVLNVKERVVTQADLDYHFPEESRSEIRDRSVLIQDIKPPFASVRMDDKDRFWMMTDETEKGKEMVVLDYEGNPLGRFYIESNEAIHEVKDDKIYVVKDPWGFASVEVYSVNL